MILNPQPHPRRQQPLVFFFSFFTLAHLSLALLRKAGPWGQKKAMAARPLPRIRVPQCSSVTLPGPARRSCQYLNASRQSLAVYMHGAQEMTVWLFQGFYLDLRIWMRTHRTKRAAPHEQTSWSWRKNRAWHVVVLGLGAALLGLAAFKSRSTGNCVCM